MESNAPQGDMIGTLVMFLCLSIPLAVTSHKLAKEKGRNVTLWTILGCLPLINYFCIFFFVGATNLRLEEKLNKLLDQQK